MSEIIILCGLMGCGKTTFAKEFAKNHNYEYLDFDFEYHHKIQKECIIDPIEDIPKLLKYISNLLNKNKDEDFIFDNWFKWHKDWWKDKEDNILQQLKEKLKFHEIKIIYLFTPFKLCYERYFKKHKEVGTDTIEKGFQLNYKVTMEERQRNLLLKISKWVTQ